MQRYILAFVTNGANSNFAPSLTFVRKGRIKAVQVECFPTPQPGSAVSYGSLIQLSNSAAFSLPNPNGINSQEIASWAVSSMTDTTATSTFATNQAVDKVIPCDFPVDNGVNLFMNAQAIGGGVSAQPAYGQIVIMVDEGK